MRHRRPSPDRRRPGGRGPHARGQGRPCLPKRGGREARQPRRGGGGCPLRAPGRVDRGGEVRTRVGKSGRALRNGEAVKLGSLVVAEAVSRAGLVGADIEEVILGNVLQAGLGQNPARPAALFRGLPARGGAQTVNKVCGSGLQAVMSASDMIRAGSAEVLVAGGMESMSRAPYLVKEARWGVGINNVQFIDAMVHDGLWDAFNPLHMGSPSEI